MILFFPNKIENNIFNVYPMDKKNKVSQSNISRSPNQLYTLYLSNNVEHLPANMSYRDYYANLLLLNKRNTEKTHLFLCLKYIQRNFAEQNSNLVMQNDNFIPPLPNEMIMYIINFV